MMYAGIKAHKLVGEILESLDEDGRYPSHVGDCGYFQNPNGVWSAFDNKTGDCWCEDFKTEQQAKDWCDGKYGMPSPIDNKNVMEDWIYEDVFPNGFLETPWNNRSNRSVVGYVDGILIMANWTFGSNYIRFFALGRIHKFSQKWRSGVFTKEEEDKALEVLDKITKSFLALNKDKNSNLQVWTVMNDNRQLDLLCSFHWKNED